MTVMKEKDFRTTKFKIIEPDALDRVLNPSRFSRFPVGKACIEAISSMKDRIQEKDSTLENSFKFDVNTEESGIRTNLKNGIITQQNFHSIICLFFHQFEDDFKYYQPYKNEHIDSFFSCLQVIHNQAGSVKEFKEFYNMLDIPEHFQEYVLSVDTKWSFNNTPQEEIDSSADFEIEKEDDSIQEETNSYVDSEFGIETYKTSPPTNKPNPKLRNRYIIASVVVSILVLFLIPLLISLFSNKPDPESDITAIDFTPVQPIESIDFTDFTSSTPNSKLVTDTVTQFYTMMFGKGTTTIHNFSIDGKGKRLLGNKDRTFAKIGDTIFVSSLVATIAEDYIKNVKVELSHYDSSHGVVHTLIGKLSGYNVEDVIDRAFLYTSKSSKLRNLNQTFYQINNSKSQLYYFNENENYDLFNGGYNLGDLFPGFDNYYSIVTQFVVEAKDIGEEPVFENNPYNLDMGHTSVQLDEATVSDVLHLSIPNYLDSQEFEVVMDLINISNSTISDARAWMTFDSFAESTIPYLPIIGQLSVSDSVFSTDVTYLTNLPKKWRLSLRRVDLFNHLQESCDSTTNDYNRSVDASEFLKHGIKLPILTTKEGNTENLPCSSGFIKARFKIENTDVFSANK